MTVNVSGASSEKEFAGEGYYYNIEKGKVNVYASSPQSLYYAVKKFVKATLLSNPNMLANIPSRIVYTSGYEAKRAEYISDVNKLDVAWEYDYTPSQKFNDFSEKISSFKNPSGRAMVIGHRGDMEYYPENSIEGIIAAVRRGVDAVEVDCALTKDGVWVLNHGNKLTPNTDFSIKRGMTIDGVTLPISEYVCDWTYEQIQKLNLRFGNGTYSDASSEISVFKVATLKEALTVVKNKCMIITDQLYRDMMSADFKQMETLGKDNPYWKSVHALITETGAYKSVLFGYLGLTKNSIEPLREELQTECGYDLVSVFDRTGTHNTVISWYAEFDCANYDALYQSYISDGVNQGGVQTPAGTFLLVNRPGKALDFVEKTYFND